MGQEIVKYLDKGELLTNKEEGGKIMRKAAQFVQVGGIIYKRGILHHCWDVLTHMKLKTYSRIYTREFVEVIMAGGPWQES